MIGFLAAIVSFLAAIVLFLVTIVPFLAAIVLSLVAIMVGLNFFYAIYAYSDGNISRILGCNLVHKPRPMSEVRDSLPLPYHTVSDTLSNLLYLFANTLTHPGMSCATSFGTLVMVKVGKFKCWLNRVLELAHESAAYSDHQI
jgi:hypothetical protein